MKKEILLLVITLILTSCFWPSKEELAADARNSYKTSQLNNMKNVLKYYYSENEDSFPNSLNELKWIPWYSEWVFAWTFPDITWNELCDNFYQYKLIKNEAWKNVNFELVACWEILGGTEGKDMIIKWFEYVEWVSNDIEENEPLLNDNKELITEDDWKEEVELTNKEKILALVKARKEAEASLDKDKLRSEIREILKSIDITSAWSDTEELLKPIYDNYSNISKKIIDDLIWEVSFELYNKQQSDDIIGAIEKKYEPIIQKVYDSLDDIWYVKIQIKKMLEISIAKWLSEEETYKNIYKEFISFREVTLDSYIKEVWKELSVEYAADAKNTQENYENNQ